MFLLKCFQSIFKLSEVMNGFQKEYWEKADNILKQKLKYIIASFVISIITNFFLCNKILSDICFAKVVTLAGFLSGIIEWKLDLPNFYIEDDKKNKKEVRVAMVVIPLVIYILLLVGWFDK